VNCNTTHYRAVSRRSEPVKIGRNNYWAEDVINNWIDELQSKSHEE